MLASVAGLDALDNELAALPAEIIARLEAKTRDLADALVAKVRDEKLSGHRLLRLPAL